jgi:quinolinate synthase
MKEIVKNIENLKKEKNALIVAHNYQLPEVQDIADFVGDSLELSRICKEAKEEVIIFCGVHFMAETAKILSPSKTIILPEISSGCPLANMIDEEKLKKEKEKYKDAVVVCYINSSAKVKAESDYCCTSSNAVNLVNKIEAKEILFVPDKYLGDYVASKTNKKIIIYDGYCPTHQRILPENILKMKKEHPEAEVIVHPECSREVVKLADRVLSTGGMVKYCKESKKTEFIIGTEVGILHRLKKENPKKIFYPASELAICLNMKKNNLQNILASLENLSPKIEVEKEIAEKAKLSIDRMLEIL